ncbi:hypothetical protein [Streptomyces fungicidicus]|uniref:Uncharacterized protein n=1 Tax=Streptomyces fungicidicus TaxID=68203 RepID=A0A494UXB7_9ACTN|nr:hypothetical protein [Streptomyces fungicidicus]AYL39170.1 hypothetical protein CNQ36_29480 [Streptomyces fungicidicus]
MRTDHVDAEAAGLRRIAGIASDGRWSFQAGHRGSVMVRQLVRAHGGDVSVASRPHMETVFLVRLPS